MFENVTGLDFNFPTFIVGGYVRDHILGQVSKDIDLCMVAPFDKIKDEVTRLGGKVFIEKPEYLTVRCKLPKLGDVDIAVARRDGGYSDGRRPDQVFIANSIHEDLSRRDLTINAIAVDVSDGTIIDPFGGVNDIRNQIIRAVGVARERVEEDYLRILRFFRFGVTKGFCYHNDIRNVFNSRDILLGLKNVSNERIRDELFRCFRFDTWLTLEHFKEFPFLSEVVFKDGKVWLEATLKER